MRQTVNVYLFIVNVVSIHASVKDATEKWAEAYAHVCVSIHASVKDATLK